MFRYFMPRFTFSPIISTLLRMKIHYQLDLSYSSQKHAQTNYPIYLQKNSTEHYDPYIPKQFE